jgi:hypothetical protein
MLHILFELKSLKNVSNRRQRISLTPRTISKFVNEPLLIKPKPKAKTLVKIKQIEEDLLNSVDEVNTIREDIELVDVVNTIGDIVETIDTSTIQFDDTGSTSDKSESDTSEIEPLPVKAPAVKAPAVKPLLPPSVISKKFSKDIVKLKSVLAGISENLDTPRKNNITKKSNGNNDKYTCDVCNTTILLRNKAKHDSSSRHKICVRRNNSIDNFNKFPTPRLKK